MEADIYNEQITQYASQLEIKKKFFKNDDLQFLFDDSWFSLLIQTLPKTRTVRWVDTLALAQARSTLLPRCAAEIATNASH